MNLGGEFDGSVSEIKPIVIIQHALIMCSVHETQKRVMKNIDVSTI